MIDAILKQLESSRSQIEGKFSRAGSVLESAITLIGQQLEFLSQLNALLDAGAIGNATQDLATTASELNALPALLDVRGCELRDLGCKSARVLRNIEDMRSVLRYLLVFALNVKITAADNALDAQQFEILAQEMRTQIENGGTALDDIETRLNELIEQVGTALRLESKLAEDASAMLPSVPNHLSADAGAIRDHQKQIAEMMAYASTLAQKIQLKVINALSSLQIGDISRQRVEHVQYGLQLLRNADERLLEEGCSDDARKRFRQFVYRLMSIQLVDTAEAFERDSRSMLSNMSDIAADAQDLLRLQQTQGESASGSEHKLRSLERRVTDAVLLVTEVEKAVANADQVRNAAAFTVDELLGRVDSIKGVREDVQFMALNTTVSCSRMGDSGKPLQVIAVELRLYAKKLDSIADATLEALRALGQEVANRDNATNEVISKSKLESAVTRLRNAADLAEAGLTKTLGQGSNVLESLSKAESELNFESDLGDILSSAAASLDELSGKDAIAVADISGPLQEILDVIGRSYTMAREREIHASFSLADIGAARAA